MNIEFKICATLDEFNTLHDAGEIQDSWIVLIEDQPALWTNGKLLPSPYTKEQLESLFVTIASKGIANGIATLNENGKIPESLLPSYVDDVLEFDNLAAFPTVGESGKIYVAIDTNLTYRWSGSTYVEISPSIALGETESTAYMGLLGARTTTLVNNLATTPLVNNGRARYNGDNNTLEFSTTVKDGHNFISSEKGLIVLLDEASKKGYGTMSSYDYNKLSTITLFVSQIPNISKTPDDLGLIQVKATVGSNGEFEFNSSDTTRIPAANSLTAGVMTAADKKKLDSITTANLKFSDYSRPNEEYGGLDLPYTYTDANGDTQEGTVWIQLVEEYSDGLMPSSHFNLTRGLLNKISGIADDNGSIYFFDKEDGTNNNTGTHKENILINALLNRFADNTSNNIVINGNGNNLYDSGSIVMGYGNSTSGSNVIIGDFNLTASKDCAIIGKGLSATSENSLNTGTYNMPYKGTGEETPLFVVGVGSNTDNRKTGFLVMKGGNIFFGDDSENKENKFYDATTKKINENFLPDSVPTTTGFTSMQVVSALPADPDPNTLYIVTA